MQGFERTSVDMYSDTYTKPNMYMKEVGGRPPPAGRKNKSRAACRPEGIGNKISGRALEKSGTEGDMLGSSGEEENKSQALAANRHVFYMLYIKALFKCSPLIPDVLGLPAALHTTLH